MANFYKIKVVWQGVGGYWVGGYNLSHGDELVLPADQFKRWVKYSDISNGYVEVIGESDNSDGAFSDNIRGYLQGKSGTFGRNYAPVSSYKLVPTTIAGVNGGGYQGADVAAGAVIGRRVGIEKLQVRTPVLSAAAWAPFVFVSAGDPVKVEPTVLRYYDNSAGTYGAVTNGSMTVTAPITWAANDLLLVGYTEKFASVDVHATAKVTAGTALTNIYYWNGSAWTAFDSFTDTTLELQTGINTIGRTGITTDTSTRYIWYEKPTDWAIGGPTGSGSGGVAYMVAIKFAGVLTGLAGGTFYPVLDTPIATDNLGLHGGSDLAAVVTYDGAAYNDYTAAAANATADDVILKLDTTQPLYVGYATPFQGVVFNVETANDQAAVLNLAYWNGKAWSGTATTAADAWGGTVLDGTLSGGDIFAQDGTISWSVVPGAWTADVATNLTGLTTNTPATVTTDSLYWMRITPSATLKVTTSATQMWVTTPQTLWRDVLPVGKEAVDANEALHVTVIDEDGTVTIEVNAVLYDI